MPTSLEVGYVTWYTNFKFKFFIFPVDTGENIHFNNTLDTYKYQWEGKQKKQCLSRSLLGTIKTLRTKNARYMTHEKLEIARPFQLFTVSADSQVTTSAIFKTFKC